MSDLNLNELPGTDAVRDAIHVAVIPLIAGEDLYESRVQLKIGTKNVALRVKDDYGGESIGVVNPWHPVADGDCGAVVRKGETFYCLLNPGTVTGMRHHFVHPAFDDESVVVDDSELWLRQFAQEWSFDFDELIKVGVNVQNATEDWQYWITACGVDLHSRGELGDDYDLFWYHLERHTGKQVDIEKRELLGWSCSC